MSLSRKIAQNTAIQMGGKIVGTALSLIAAGFVLRYLGDDGFGRYTKIVAFLQVFGILMDMGLYIVLIKRLSELTEHSKREANTIFTLRVLSGILVLGAAPLVAWLISLKNPLYDSEIVLGIALTSLFFFFISLNQLLSAVFHKFLRTDWIALAELVGKLVLLGTTLLVIWQGLPLLWVMSTLVFSSAANFLVTFLASRKYLTLKFQIDLSILKSVFTEAWPIALSIFFGLMYFKGDTVILSFFEPDNVVGWYGAPYKILEVLITFPAMFAGLALPVLTAAWKNQDTERFRRLLQKSFDALVIFALPMVFGAIALAPHIIGVIAGAEYGPSIPILKILIVATGAIFVGTLFTYLVVALNKQRTMIFGYAFAALTSLAAYLIVIPRYSIYGAAWVTVYSEFAILGIALFIVLRTSKVSIEWGRTLKSLATSALMYGLIMFITPKLAAVLPSWSQLGTDLFMMVALVPIGAVFYFVFMVALRAISISDIKEMTSLRSTS